MAGAQNASSTQSLCTRNLQQAVGVLINRFACRMPPHWPALLHYCHSCCNIEPPRNSYTAAPCMLPGGSRTARSRRLTRRERPPPAATLASSCSTSHCPFPTVLYSSVLRMPPRRTACQTWRTHSAAQTADGVRDSMTGASAVTARNKAQWATAPHPDEQVRAAVPATEGEAAAGNVTRVRHVHRCVVPRSSG